MILPIAGPLGLALSFYEIPVEVRDTAYTTDEDRGEDVQTLLATRTIQAAIDPSRSKQLVRIFGGSVSKGDIGIYTKAELYYNDIYIEGDQQKQSFVTYEGATYRVTEVGDWNPIAELRVYLAERHVKQGEVV